MPTIFGTTGDDTLTGTGGDNVFDVSQGGEDFVSGLKGNDTFIFGAEFRFSDEVHGGEGFDTLRLDGNYSSAVNIGLTTMDGVESIELAAGHDYFLKLNSNNAVAAGQTLFVNGSLLGPANGLKFGGANELDGNFDFTGGAGNDSLTGGGGLDNFRLELGGKDSASGGGGNDFFRMGANFGASDRLDGGTGSNTLILDGDYSGGVHLGASTIANIQGVTLVSGHSYKLFLNDGNVAAGATVFITAQTIAGQSVTIDAAAETDGHVSFNGGAGDDVFIGGAQGDSFFLTAGGRDVAKGGAGADSFNALAHSFTAADHIDGGTGLGTDTFSLNGDYSAGMHLSAAQMVNIEQMNFGIGASYKFTTSDNVVAAGATLVISAGGLLAGQAVTFDGGADTDGGFNFLTGAGDDVLIGGAAHNAFHAGLGADQMTGGASADNFLYQDTAADSTSIGHDTIFGFDAANDDLFLFNGVDVVEAEITVGSLNNANFDARIASAVGALAPRHAVLFTPDQGPLAGHTYLVINTDGVAGYQAGTDLLIEMQGMLNKASLDPLDFH